MSDIREKAQGVFNALCEDAEVWATHGMPGAHKEEIIVAAIAKAIESERERCAEIAMSSRSTPSRDMDASGTTLAIDIASAIRGGE